MGIFFCGIDSIKFNRIQSKIKGNTKFWVILTGILQTLHKYTQKHYKVMSLKKIKPLFFIVVCVHYHVKVFFP